VLISYSSDLGWSALCALFILTVNNFLYGQNLTKIFWGLILHILMYGFMKKTNRFFENSIPRRTLKDRWHVVTGDDRGQDHANWRQFYFLNLHRPWKREKQHSMICVHFRFLVVLSDPRAPTRQTNKIFFTWCRFWLHGWTLEHVRDRHQVKIFDDVRFVEEKREKKIL